MYYDSLQSHCISISDTLSVKPIHTLLYFLMLLKAGFFPVVHYCIDALLSVLNIIH